MRYFAFIVLVCIAANFLSINAENELIRVGNVGNKIFYTSSNSSNLTWMKAQEYCHQLPSLSNAKLASLETLDEETLVAQFLNQNGDETVGPVQFWLSATDFENEGVFRWTRSGKSADLSSNIIQFESDALEHNCLKIQLDAAYYDESCSKTFHQLIWTLCEVICEETEPSTPEQPQPTTPEQPQPTTPEQPQPTTPEQPQPTTPEQPQPTTPEQPQPTTPEQPQPTTPEQPQPTTPEQPKSTTPEQPQPTTPEEPQTTTTVNPITSTSSPPSFECKAEGSFPDPILCNVYHVCIRYQNSYIDYTMTCPAFTNYCPIEQVCGDIEDCPCNHNLDEKVEPTEDLVIPQYTRNVTKTLNERAGEEIYIGNINGKSLFTFQTGNLNWIDAMELCHSKGYMMARLESEEERARLIEFLEVNYYAEYFWLSGVDYGSEDEYYWFGNGGPVDYAIYGNGGRENNCMYLCGCGPVYDWSCENHQNQAMWPLCQKSNP